ncbi:MAG: hypothetical protein US69_C0011G0032 [candidate division TM6 bacterium GW2011_GWF2_38_10]|nr:MAG: hypothetical protein US69_C0011G0032 [candidate division TM6 bacterium GW2011_GWF2_38_10]
MTIRRNIFIILFLNILIINSYAIIKKVDEKLLSIVIPSYNNSEWYATNLASIFSQVYTNYHVYYIDDYSSDGTYELVKKYIQVHHLEDKVTLLQNKKRLGAAGSRDFGISLCPDESIVINIDGDDWFSRDDFFSTINIIYNDKNIWLTYGQHFNWPTNSFGYGEDFPRKYVLKRDFRDFKWIVGHPRTFYAWLYKQIDKNDLYRDGKFFTAATDCAIMYPLLEMVGSRYKFISTIFYNRNVASEINVFKTDDRNKQRDNLLFIKKKNKYPIISSLPFNCDKTQKSYIYTIKKAGSCKKQWSSQELTTS